jgi:hypothetical protein
MNDGNRLLFERIFQNAEFVRSLGIQLTSFGKGWCEQRRICKSDRLSRLRLAMGER